MAANVFEYQSELISQVEKVLETSDVKPGFQHDPRLIEFENKISFATGEAIAAFARRAQAQLSSREGEHQRHLIRRLIELVTSSVAPEEMKSKCLDVSIVI